MQEFKGTPGPYTAHVSIAQWYSFENKFFEVADKDGAIIAFVKDWDGAGDLPKKDAQLLAAAPELLEALQGLVRSYEDFRKRKDKEGSPEASEIIKARYAIYKALGK